MYLLACAVSAQLFFCFEGEIHVFLLVSIIFYMYLLFMF